MPGFILVLDPGRRRYVRGFLRRVLRFAIPAGPLSGTAADAGHQAIPVPDPWPGSAGAAPPERWSCWLSCCGHCWSWPVLLAGCMPTLVTTMTGMAAMIVAVPAPGTGVFLLNPAPLPLLVAAVAGAAGATLAEVSCRAIALATRGGSSPESRKEGIAGCPLTARAGVTAPGRLGRMHVNTRPEARDLGNRTGRGEVHRADRS